MFFARLAFLTGSFNSAIGATANTARLAMSAGTIMDTANDKNDKKDGVERTMKSATKLMLLGML